MNFRRHKIAFFITLLSVGILSMQLKDSNVCQCSTNIPYCYIMTSCKDSPIIKSGIQLLNISIINDETTRCGRAKHASEHPKFRELHRIIYHNILESIVEVMLFWKRYHGVIIADKFSGIDENAQKYLKTVGLDMKIISGNDMEETKNILQPDSENFIVICNAKNTWKILKAANESALFNGLQTWIIVAHQLPPIFNSIQISPQTFVTLFIPSKNAHGLLKDFITFEIETSIMDDPPKQYSQSPFIHCYNAEVENGVSIVLSTESKIALEYSSTSRVSIFDVFYGHANERTEAVQFGTWQENQGMFMFEILNPEDREQRVRGRMIRTVIFEHQPYNFVTEDNGKLIVEGYCKDLIDMLMDTLNIRYTIREVPKVFGGNVNGTFTGLVGILSRKESEITLSLLAMTNSRRQVIRYTGPIMKSHMSLCYNTLEAIMPPTAFLLPFQPLVWILVFGSAIVLGILVMVVMSKSPGSYRTSTPSKEIHSSTYRVLTGIVFEEALEDPPGIPSKIIFGTLLLTTLLVFIHYTTVFTSFLTSLDVPIPFQNLEDVIKNKEYAIIYLHNSRYHDAFRYAPDGLFAEVWQNMKSNKKTVALEGGIFEEGFKMMAKGKYVFMTDGSTAYYLAAHNCTVAFASQIYLPEFFFTTSRLDFPYARILTISIIRAMEGGILQRLAEVYKVNRKPICKGEKGSSSLGLNQMAAVFIVWFFGIIIALVAFCCERTVFKKYAENPMETEPFQHYL